MSTHKKYAHELVAETAKEMAGVFYDEFAKDNDFYKFYPSQKKFIKREWGRFIAPAKATLAQMLNFSTTPEWQKEQIMDALIKHASLPGNVNRIVAEKLVAEGNGPKVTVH